jgi:hypothetical protein
VARAGTVSGRGTSAAVACRCASGHPPVRVATRPGIGGDLSRRRAMESAASAGESASISPVRRARLLHRRVPRTIRDAARPGW